jgi:hypothetical protein
MTKTKKVIRKKKIKNNNDNNDNIDDDDDDDTIVESNFKLLNKRVLKIQNNNIKYITNSFIKNDGYVSLSVY